MSKATVNGDFSHSQTINHVTSYPLIADLLNIYQQNSLGAQSIHAFNRAYSTFAEPVLPYFQTPYSILKPYLDKADHLGDSGLTQVDSRFPVVKDTNLEKLQGTAYNIAAFPFRTAASTKDYVFNTYNDEYKKTGGQGIVFKGQAVVTTEMRIVAETMHALADYLGPKRDELLQNFDSAKKAAGEKAQHLSDYTRQQAQQTQKTAQQKKDQAAQQINSH